jgi:ABC-type Zn uptake system ZnuABC Zn-binding protein ZnuA
LEQRQSADSEPDAAFIKAERLMPKLLTEMREDLAKYPLKREFVVLKKAWSYWAKGNELFYFYDDHPELDEMLQILENLSLVREITYNNTKRYIITEHFADYLVG